MRKEAVCPLCNGVFIKNSGAHKYCPDCSPDKSANLRAGRFAMGQKEYEDRLASQGGVCLLCCKISRRFVVDHDHATGAVRGILCTPCNSVLGQLEAGKPIKTRSSEWVKKAKEYLRASPRPKSNRNVE